jgi:hypothetical protein
MKTLPRSTARDVFSHLLAIATLYVGVISFTTLCFQYINVKFPDLLNLYYSGALDTIRQAMAALIVVWPVFILMSWFIQRDIKADPDKHNVGIRKWLLYLTLFVTSITIIVDLVTLINYFLNGEITTRFILKVLVVLAVAITVFWYYLWDLRTEAPWKSKLPKVTAVLTSVVVVGTILLGFMFVGSPMEQRQLRIDGQRVTDLSSLQGGIVDYYSRKQVLPKSLSELSDPLTYFVVPVDPETGAAYEYVAKDKYTFELCANFAKESDVDPATTRPYVVNDPYSQNWLHSAGRACFERTIDPEQYPPLK